MLDKKVLLIQDKDYGYFIEFNNKNDSHGLQLITTIDKSKARIFNSPEAYKELSYCLQLLKFNKLNAIVEDI